MAEPDEDPIGVLLEAFVNRVSHTRGRAMEFMLAASITPAQAILLHTVLITPDCAPSDVAAAMRLSPSSVSQMIDRLSRQGFLHRVEATDDRRRKALALSASGQRFLDDLRALRIGEYAAGAAGLSSATRDQLVEALYAALAELDPR